MERFRQAEEYKHNKKPQDLSKFGTSLQRFSFFNRYYQPQYETPPYVKDVEEFTFETLKKTGLFQAVHPSHPRLDEEEGIDGFIELPSGRILAVDITFAQSPQRQREKAAEVIEKEAQLPGFEVFGKIPRIPLKFDEKKYREIVEEKRPLDDPETAQLELIDTIIEMLKLKMETRVNQEHREHKKAKVTSYYQGYIKELEQLREALYARLTMKKAA